MIYDYKKNIKEDILDYIDKNYSEPWQEIIFRDIFRELYYDYDITGIFSGSYWHDKNNAFMCMFGNEYLLQQVLDNELISPKNLYDWEVLDTVIRSYLLEEVIQDMKEDAINGSI